MDDQGEKIVFLAREMLGAGVPDIEAKKKTANVSMTFRTLCFTTLLAAAGGGAVTAYMHEAERPLNRYEKIEIQALVFYTAKLKGIDEDNLRREVEQQVGIDRIDDMTAAEFPAARKYLQEKAR